MNTTATVLLNDVSWNEEQLLAQFVESLLDARSELAAAKTDRQWSQILRQACRERRAANRTEALAAC
jgi:hypothetical protein